LRGADHEGVTDRMSTMLKYAARNSGVHIEPLLIPFLTLLNNAFAKTRFASLLYAATQLVLVRFFFALCAFPCCVPFF
jgi:hypothetical protein